MKKSYIRLFLCLMVMTFLFLLPNEKVKGQVQNCDTLWIENFNDTNGNLPSGWLNPPDNSLGNTPWLITSNNGNNIDGTKMAFFNDPSETGSYGELVTNVIDLTDESYGQYILEFDYNFKEAQAIWGNRTSKFEVWVWTNADWELIFELNTSNCGSWDCNYPRETIDITSYISDDFRLSFDYDDNYIGNTHYAAVDNILICGKSVEVTGNCPDGLNSLGTVSSLQEPPFCLGETVDLIFEPNGNRVGPYQIEMNDTIYDVGENNVFHTITLDESGLETFNFTKVIDQNGEAANCSITYNPPYQSFLTVNELSATLSVNESGVTEANSCLGSDDISFWLENIEATSPFWFHLEVTNPDGEIENIIENNLELNANNQIIIGSDNFTLGVAGVYTVALVQMEDAICGIVDFPEDEQTTVTVTVHDLVGILNLPNGSDVCAGDSLALTLDMTAGTLDGDFEISATIAGIEKTYTLQNGDTIYYTPQILSGGTNLTLNSITDLTTGCVTSGTQNISINVKANPNVIITTTDDEYCGDDIMLTANPNPNNNIPIDNYTWSENAENSTNNTAIVASGGTYSVTATSADGCIDIEEVEITASNSISDFDIFINGDTLNTANDINYVLDVCDTDVNEEINISLNPQSNLLYQLNQDTPNISGNWTTIFDAAETKEYDLIVTGEGYCEKTISISITVNKSLSVPALELPDSASICSNETWIGMASISNGNFVTASIYQWEYPNGSIIDGNTINTNLEGTYTVTVTADNGCSASSSVFLEVINMPEVTIIASNDNNIEDENVAWICTVPAGSATLTAEIAEDVIATSYQWAWTQGTQEANLGDTNSIELLPPSGLYTVAVTFDNGCVVVDSINVLVSNMNNNLIMSSTPVVCGGNAGSATVEIQASINYLDVGVSPFTYVWSNGVINSDVVESTNIISNLAAGDYTVTITDAIGCELVESVTVESECPCTVPPAPTSDNLEQTICANELIEAFTASVEADYYINWYDASEGGNLIAENTNTFTPDTAGIYYAEAVFGEDATCVSETRTAFTLTINDLPEASISVNDEVLSEIMICENEEIILTASSGSSYLWNTTPPETTQSITVSEAGSYTVTVTENGCENTQSITVNVNSLPNAEIATNLENNATTICEGENITLTVANEGNFYEWSTTPQQTTQSITVSEAGIYTVTVTDENGCTASDNIDINVKLNPEKTEETIEFSPDGCLLNLSFDVAGSIFYNSSSITFQANIINTFTIISGTNVGTLIFVPDDSETYCNLEFEIGEVICDADCPITPNLTANETIFPICYYDAIPIFSITTEDLLDDYEIEWFDEYENEIDNENEFQYQPDVTEIGIYNYSVKAVYTGNQGCDDSNAIDFTLVINDFPEASISVNDEVLSEIMICENEEIILTASSGSSYLWNTTPPETTQSITVSEAGSYTVTVTDENGCTASDNIDINVKLNPEKTEETIEFSLEGCLLNLSFDVAGSIFYNSSSTAFQANIINTFTIISGTNVGTLIFVPDDSETYCNLEFEVGDVTCDADCPITPNLTANEIIFSICYYDAIPIFSITTEDLLDDYEIEWFDEYENEIDNENEFQYQPDVTEIGIYNYSVKAVYTGNQGCDDSNAIDFTLVINDFPEASISVNDEVLSEIMICENEEIILTASGGSSYVWNTTPPETTQSITVSEAGIYTVTVTDENGCTAASEIEITVNSLPEAAITSNDEDNTICQNEEVILTASGGSTYLWNTFDTTENIIEIPSTTTSYFVTATDDYGCTATSEIQIIANSLPEAAITSNDEDNTICENEEVILIASGGSSYLWDTGAGTESITVSEENSYFVTVTDANGCTASDNININIKLNPEKTEETIEFSLEGCLLNLSFDVAGSIFYNNSSIAFEANIKNSIVVASGTNLGTLIFVPDDSETYCNLGFEVGEVTCSAGCPITPNLTTNETTFSICIGSDNPVFSVNEELDSNYQYQWFYANGNPISDANAESYQSNETTAGTYQYSVKAIYIGDESCDDSNIIDFVLTINDLPDADAGSDQSICEGESTTLTASGGTAYEWNTTPPETTQSITISEAGIYIVTVTDANDCTATDEVEITVNPLPTAEITSSDADNTICEGEEVNLSVPFFESISYLWSTNDTMESITISEAGNYTVTVTDANDCTASDNININVKLNPEKTEETIEFSLEGCLLNLSFDVAGSIFYNNSSIAFEANIENTIVITSGTNLGTLIFVPDDSETYCNLEFEIGEVTCSAECPTTPNLTTNETTFSICIGSDNPTFSVNEILETDYQYQWFDENGNLISDANAESYQSNETTAGTYQYSVKATYTGDESCDDSNIIDFVLTINDLPNADAGLNQSICEGDSITLTASGGTAYEWNTTPPETTQSITISEAGIYIVTVTDANDCTATDEVEITVNPLPEVSISSNIENDTICEGDSITLTAIGGGSYIWDTIHEDTTQSITVSPETTTNYSVTVTENGCESTENINIIVETCEIPCPTNIFAPTGDTTQIICAGHSIEAFEASVENDYYINWYDASEGGTLLAIDTTAFIPDAAGIYYAEAVFGEDTSCVSETRTAFTLTINPSPTAEITTNLENNTSIICEGDSITLTANEASSYLWTTGEAAQSIIVLEAGIYTVIVTNEYECTKLESIDVIVKPNPTNTLDSINYTSDGCELSLAFDVAGSIVYDDNTTHFEADISEIFKVTSGTNMETLTFEPDTSLYCPLDIDIGIVTCSADCPTIPNIETVNDETNFSICYGTDNPIFSVTGILPPDYQYQWFSGTGTEIENENESSYQPDVIETGIYQYSVKAVYTGDESCDDSNIINFTLTVENLPNAEAGLDKTICVGESATLTASGGTSYIWNDDLGNTSEITVYPETTTNYSVIVTDENGCTATDTVQVMVNPLPTAEINDEIPFQTTICENDTITLTASYGENYIYEWSTNDTTQSITVTPNINTNYIVTITENDCESTASALISVEELPNIGLSNEIINVYNTSVFNDCDISDDVINQPVNLNSYLGTNISGGTWTGINADGSEEVLDNPTQMLFFSYPENITGEYNFIYQLDVNTAYCEEIISDTLKVNFVNCACQLTLSTTNYNACIGDASQVNLNEWLGTGTEPTGEWNVLGNSNGISINNETNILNITNEASGNYAIQYELDCGVISSEIPINIIDLSNIGLDLESNAADNTICGGDLIRLEIPNFNADYTCQWSEPNASVSNCVLIHNPNTTTNYEVTITDVNGCTTIDELEIIVVEPPTLTGNPIVNVIADNYQECEKDTLNLWEITNYDTTGVFILTEDILDAAGSILYPENDTLSYTEAESFSFVNAELDSYIFRYLLEADAPCNDTAEGELRVEVQDCSEVLCPNLDNFIAKTYFICENIDTFILQPEDIINQANFLESLTQNRAKIIWEYEEDQQDNVLHLNTHIFDENCNDYEVKTYSVFSECTITANKSLIGQITLNIYPTLDENNAKFTGCEEQVSDFPCSDNEMANYTFGFNFNEINSSEKPDTTDGTVVYYQLNWNIGTNEWHDAIACEYIDSYVVGSACCPTAQIDIKPGTEPNDTINNPFNIPTILICNIPQGTETGTAISYEWGYTTANNDTVWGNSNANFAANHTIDKQFFVISKALQENGGYEEYLVKVIMNGCDTAIATYKAPNYNNIANKQTAIKLYPNPNNGSFTLAMQHAQNGKLNINIYDMVGKPIYTIKAQKETLSFARNINLPDIKQGVYFVEIILNDQEKYIEKIVVF